MRDAPAFLRHRPAVLVRSVVPKVSQRRDSFALVITLCFATALIDGFDLQAVGIAAPKIAAFWDLDAGRIGLLFTAATIGLIIGGLSGGQLADRVGRKTGLIAALLVFGSFSLASAYASTFEQFLVLRFFVGCGLGGALPNLVALVAESAPLHRRGVGIAAMVAGIPLGSAIAGVVAMTMPDGADSFRIVFIVGGAAPIAMAIALYLFLPAASSSRTVPAGVALATGGAASGQNAIRAVPSLGAFARALLGKGNAVVTLVVWANFFLSLLVLSLILNWLPSLLVKGGFSFGQSSTVLAALNIGGALGSVALGQAMDAGFRRAAIAVAYGLVVACLASLALLPPIFLVAVPVCFFLGIGLVGGQSILYGLAPLCYPAEVRGTGIGTAVAVGRLGSITGPLVASALLLGGATSAGVLLTVAPVAFVGGSMAMILAQRSAARAAIPN